MTDGQPNAPTPAQLPVVLPPDESSGRSVAEDVLGHDRYVRALDQLIARPPEGTTIGLFGGYGVGKTWTVRRLKHRLADRHPPIGLVEYDAWRYADDEIRRDFLVQLHASMKKEGLFFRSPRIRCRPVQGGSNH